MNRKVYPRLAFVPALLLALVPFLQGCEDPMSVETPRRITTVSTDSVLYRDPIFAKGFDTLYSRADGRAIEVTTKLISEKQDEEPVVVAWYDVARGGSVKVGTKEDADATTTDRFASLPLRFEVIRDTGTYSIAKDGRLIKVGLLDPFAAADAIGEIRVMSIDPVRNVIIGTFRLFRRELPGLPPSPEEEGIFRFRIGG